MTVLGNRKRGGRLFYFIVPIICYMVLKICSTTTMMTTLLTTTTNIRSATDTTQHILQLENVICAYCEYKYMCPGELYEHDRRHSKMLQQLHELPALMMPHFLFHHPRYSSNSLPPSKQSISSFTMSVALRQVRI